MSSKRATPEEQAHEIERLRSLIAHIQKQAETLEGAAERLPDGIAESFGEKAGELRQTADVLLRKVEGRESKRS